MVYVELVYTFFFYLAILVWNELTYWYKMLENFIATKPSYNAKLYNKLFLLVMKQKRIHLNKHWRMLLGQEL